MFFCLLKKSCSHVSTNENRTKSYSIARIVLNRTIGRFICIIFVHVIPRAHVHPLSTNRHCASDGSPGPTRIFERRHTNIRDGLGE